jgi:hypothetical protein
MKIDAPSGDDPVRVRIRASLTAWTGCVVNGHDNCGREPCRASLIFALPVFALLNNSITPAALFIANRGLLKSVRVL